MYAPGVWQKLIRSGTLPAYDLRFGTTLLPISAATRHTQCSVTNALSVAQERPCARCIKRNIGHLCRDEPREPEQATKKAKTSQHSSSAVEENGTPPAQVHPKVESGMSSSFDQARQDTAQDSNLGLGTTLSQAVPLQLVQPSPVSGAQANALNSNSNQCKSRVIMTPIQ